MNLDAESKLIKSVAEIHIAVCGDEFDVNKPGLLRTVQKHDRTLYGESGRGGVAGSSRRLQKYFWMCAGAVILLQAYWAWRLAIITASTVQK
jgi:hypothetical protein